MCRSDIIYTHIHVESKYDVLTFDDTYQIPVDRVLYIDAGICIGSYLFCNWNHVAPLLVKWTWTVMSLISNFRCVLYVISFFPGNSPASESYMPTFRNTLSLHHHRQVGEHIHAYEDGTGCFETSAYKIQTPGNYPEESIQQRCTSSCHGHINKHSWQSDSVCINALVFVTWGY